MFSNSGHWPAKLTVENVNDDTGWFSATWDAGVIARICSHCVANEQVTLQAVVTCFDGELHARRWVVVSCVAQHAHPFVPGEMGGRFGHLLGHTRQVDVAAASYVHFRAAVDHCLRHCKRQQCNLIRNNQMKNGRGNVTRSASITPPSPPLQVGR